MKVVRFLKRVSIVAIPIFAVVILLLCFNSISILSFNAVHPDKLSRDLFANNMFNTYWILISIGTSLGVFFKLRNWGKEKVRHGAAEKPAQGGTQKDSAQKERGKGDLIWETSLLRKRTCFVSTTPAAAPG